MNSLSKEDWIQIFCLHLAIAEPHAFDGALLAVARGWWETSGSLDPADAVQQLLLDRALQRRGTWARILPPAKSGSEAGP